MGKRAYFIRKIVNAMLTIILVASFNFFLFRIMPGDPARMLVPKGKFDFNAIKAQRKVFHLDKPVWEQFIYYWSDTAQLHFGNSFAEKRPVTQIISERIWATIILCSPTPSAWSRACSRDGDAANRSTSPPRTRAWSCTPCRRFGSVC